MRSVMFSLLVYWYFFC
ncbi:hypothetical protein Pint_02854 [Pistacia integerrima]|uniref:Uncharacterized protein n=1 Tax=Pistacia integerrima TaxID=434235 RepID=A0ACC0ZLL0_9ROSI|nr:hypothetical protein Pint_02854 [Pistacia integerrima]